MSYAPSSIKALAAFWVAQGGVNLGIVGNLAHRQRQSYHNGKDAITEYGRTAVNDYSIRTARDKAGLTNAASALDIGRLNGSLTDLWEFSRWFAEQCLENKPGYGDVREVIFWSPIRNRVIGWSDLNPTLFLNDYGDLSHKTHTHISFYRDSETRAKVPMFSGYPAFGAPVEEEMVLSQNLPGFSAIVKSTANVRSAPKLNAPILRVVSTPEYWVLTGAVKGDVDPDGGSDQWYVAWSGGRWEYTAASNLTGVPLAPPTQVELAAATQAAATARQALATANARLADCTTKVTNAKAALA